ncbi:hypothetical protein DY000_02061593 [Brassica cretica]|uniref:Peptidase M16 C-terminal domain-containing protein n=1 Tax=Brassica cretica TaxID=69181 RepID=A0ABQ7AV67_BRACR|nr:hypothetical protein DY000_02061593 [Brassica cretica]
MDFSVNDDKDKNGLPVLLRKSLFSRLWYKPETTFSIPKPYVKIDFNCPLAVNSPDTAALTDTFVRYILWWLSCYLSPEEFTMYVSGNVRSSEAEEMVTHIEDVLYNDTNPICRPFSPSQQLTNRVVKLQEGKKYIYRQEGSNPSNENSALVHYIQVHQDEFSINIKLQLFHLIAKQASFHQLRTVEKLGYITSLSQRNDSGVYGVQFIIQSSVKGPGHIDSRVESLLKNLESKLYEMSDEEFKRNVTALIDIKLEKHKNLNEESMFYWREIQNGTLKFNRRDAEVAALRELKKVELIGFFDEYIKVDAPKKKSLSACVYGSQHLKEMESDKVKVVTPCIERSKTLWVSKSLNLCMDR